MVKDSNDVKEVTLDDKSNESDVTRREKNLLVEQYEQQKGLDESFNASFDELEQAKESKESIAVAEQLWTLDSLKEFATECEFSELHNEDGNKNIAIVYSGDYQGENGPVPAYKLAEYFQENPTVATDVGLVPDGYSLISIGGTLEGWHITCGIEQLKEQGVELSEDEKKEIWDSASENYAKQVNAAMKERRVAAIGLVANAKSPEESTFKRVEEAMLTDSLVLTDAPLSKDGKPQNSIDKRMFLAHKDGRIVEQ